MGRLNTVRRLVAGGCDGGLERPTLPWDGAHQRNGNGAGISGFATEVRLTLMGEVASLWRLPLLLIAPAGSWRRGIVFATCGQRIA
ncbi:MAG: hypothetical protein M1370_11720 [Bacteroidetes bacterium]|nr:hypothetical protein [Bacteroidota bacterium]MCL5025966.1 hypothetical protein [Chloroflexota bacterium]